MTKFKAFLMSIPRNKNGYAPDLLDMESDRVRDMATIAYLIDLGNFDAAETFHFFSDEQKNEYYSSLEILMQDEIDKFNDEIGAKKEVLMIQEFHLFDANYKYQHFNQAMYDAGHKPADFC